MSVPRLVVMDDIASRRAVYICGFITALFSVGLSLARLTGRPDAQGIAVPISTAAISDIPDGVPEVPPAVSAAELTLPAGKQSADTIGEKGRPGAATVEGELETPLRPMGDAIPSSRNITGVEPEDPALSARSPPRQVSIKQHRTRARTPGARTAASAAPKLYSPNKYHQVPRGAEKMFDANWQPKAFAYQ
jgi:hypothetical protein